MNLEEFDQVWCVFDKDDCDDDEFNCVIEDAKRQGLRVAYSNQSFELWYLLHFDCYDEPMHRRKYLGELNKCLGHTYKKNAKDMYEQLYSKQNTAIENADHLLDLYSPRNPAKDNPSTTVHLLVQQLNRFLPGRR